MCVGGGHRLEKVREKITQAEVELGESLVEIGCSELGFRKVRVVVPGTQLFPPFSVCYHLRASGAHLSRA